MDLIKTRGLILKARDYKEKDRLLYLFTGDLGKITVLVKGVRAAKGRYQAAAQPMMLCDFVLYPGKNIYTLNEASPVHSFSMVKSDFDRITIGSYFLELADLAMVDKEPNERFFVDLVKALYLLDESAIDPHQLARAFEIKTLVRTCNLPDPALAQRMTESARKLVWTMLNRSMEEAIAMPASAQDLLTVKHLTEQILGECLPRRPRSLDILNMDY